MAADRKRLAEQLRLYLICGEGDTPDEVLRKTAAALEGGVTAVQLRVKSWTGRECYNTALALKDLCHAHGAALLVNDRLDIALAAGADGVHLGQKDLPVGAARQIAAISLITPSYVGLVTSTKRASGASSNARRTSSGGILPQAPVSASTSGMTNTGSTPVSSSA